MYSFVLMCLIASALGETEQHLQPIRVNKMDTLGTITRTSSSSATEMAFQHIFGTGRAVVTNGNPDLGPAFYFGLYAGLTKASSSYTLAVPGAMEEILAVFQSIFIYYENNNQPGFQYNLGSDAFTQCGTESTDVDCADTRDVIDLSNITWAAIGQSVRDCPNGQFQSSKCKVWSINLAGFLNGEKVIQLTSMTSSHPVFVQTVTGETVGTQPGKLKIDVTISYPWKQRKSTLANPQVGLAVWSSGLSLGQSTIKSQQILYKQSAMSHSSFGWDIGSFVQNSTINQPSTVYSQVYPGSQILNYNCGSSAVTSTCGAELQAWQNRTKYFASKGQKSDLMLFSWGNVPENGVIMWDPDVVTSEGSFGIPSILIIGLFLLVLLYLIQ